MGAVRSLEAEGAAERATLQQLAEELAAALKDKEEAEGRVTEAGHKVGGCGGGGVGWGGGFGGREEAEGRVTEAGHKVGGGG
jgi:hypothetical protein